MQKTIPFLSEDSIDQTEQHLKAGEKVSQNKRLSLLNISVWSEKDIEVIHQAQKEMNKWKLIV